MRIISGSAGGRRLFTPKDLRIRPTSDRVKEALFSILTARLGSFTGIRVLDLFAGTGNLGIEALSRGADSALFVDENRDAAALAARNLELSGFADRGKVVRKDALSLLKHMERTGTHWDLVFLDPPYGKGLPERALQLLASSSLVDGTSLIVVETAAGEALPDAIGRLRVSDRRIYGDTAITFYSCTGE